MCGKSQLALPPDIQALDCSRELIWLLKLSARRKYFPTSSWNLLLFHASKHGIEDALKCPVATEKGEKKSLNQLQGKSHFLTLVATNAHMAG